ncbi:AI-2E family transporter [Candidatus Pacearchaeota archaeon]|nr:AI-2E family transporter [Candidatus Pacearchaeota archaeon]
MLDKKVFNQITTIVLIVGLFILAWMIVKPIIISVFFGILLGYIFYPVYKWLRIRLKNETFTALLICLSLFFLAILVVSLLLASLLSQALNLYLSYQQVDFLNVARGLLPDFLAESEASTNLINSINTFVTTKLSSMLSEIPNLILNLPVMIMNLFVVMFIFFFSLKDGKKGIEYLRSISPLRKETEEKFFKQFGDITYSVLLGQIVVGILQGFVAGLGYFVFQVPNATILTLLTMFVGVIPIIGPWLVWIPVDIYLFSVGKNFAGLGLLIYGLIIISWLDAFIRPYIVSRKTKINPAIVIIGMIGGLFTFGILGLIIGPLVLAYILLVFELYRKKTNDINIIFMDTD